MAQNLVTIKGTPKCLVIHLDTQYDFNEIKSALKAHINNANGFFSGAKYRFHASDSSLTNEQYKHLIQVCSEYGLIPISDSEIADHDSKTKGTASITKGLSDLEMQQQSHFIIKNIRNGEKHFYKGNLILLGDINPGSEVAATGNVVVMGSVKGIVHAGAEGNHSSFIVASILDPMQIRIGKLIARKPEKTNQIKNHTPEIAKVDNDTIIILPYVTGGLSQTC